MYFRFGGNFVFNFEMIATACDRVLYIKSKTLSKRDIASRLQNFLSFLGDVHSRAIILGLLTLASHQLGHILAHFMWGSLMNPWVISTTINDPACSLLCTLSFVYLVKYSPLSRNNSLVRAQVTETIYLKETHWILTPIMFPLTHQGIFTSPPKG